MVVDVIDIRKRIEKIRNEVSEAIVSKHSYSLPDEQLREDVQFSVEDAELREAAPELPLENEAVPAQTPQTGVSETSIAMHKAMTKAMSMPAFNLNIKNRHSSGLLITLIILQLMSNLMLMAILLLK
ncbi:hypothetical protein HIMB100_00014890 [SAR116 cluster alpha proteobacterium HIMB100]|nr:hypothetical protein HIMB100_00014890 [SAR116 cluster alpha proteobacterium HIMB100]